MLETQLGDKPMVDVVHSAMSGAELHPAKLVLGNPVEPPGYVGQTYFTGSSLLVAVGTSTLDDWVEVPGPLLTQGNAAPSGPPDRAGLFYFDGTSSQLYASVGEIETLRWFLINSGGAPAAPSAAPATLFVSTTGDDANDGLTEATAFATIQKAVDTMVSYPIPEGEFKTIKVAAGNYTQTTSLSPFEGGGVVVIDGDLVNADKNVIISRGEADAFISQYPISGWGVRGFRIDVSGTMQGFSILSALGLEIDRCDFGPVGGSHINVSGSSSVVKVRNCRILGGAESFISATYGATVTVEGNVDVVNAPDFATAFVKADLLSLVDSFATITGAATGRRYQVATNAVIFSGDGSAEYFPGNVAGTTETGGQYV